MLYRSTSRPASGIARAETSMKAASASDSSDRLHPRSSVIGFSISPKA